MNNFDIENFDKPWEKSCEGVPLTLDYPSETLYESIEKISLTYPNYTALVFIGKKTKYKNFVSKIQQCAKALKVLNIKPSDNVTLIMPNCPQALIMFYAVNCVGAVANMVHPLSSEYEIQNFLNMSKSKFALTLDMFASKFDEIINKTCIEKLIVASISEELSSFKKIAYKVSVRNKHSAISSSSKILNWKSFMSYGNNFDGRYKENRNAEDDAVIIYSGGTTGVPKGIRLSNFAINSLAVQLFALNKKSEAGDAVYAAMPIFHGFGLAMTCHGTLFNGGCCVLVPRFNSKSFINDVVKYKCTLIAGVPTLFEGILKYAEGKNFNLSFLKGVFCGGDVLPVSLENRFNKFLSDNNSNVKIRAGYGLTESVTAVCVSPEKHKSGSVGIPLPDNLIKICEPNSQNQISYGQTGEICIYGPSLMNGYLNNIEETNQVLRKHSDGRVWLHTGDLGYIDEDGFLFFVQRIKRIIISSGYNIYPTQIETAFNSHKCVDSSCAIGIPDPYKGQKIKVFIKLNEDAPETEETKKFLIEYAKKHIAKYALPEIIEFRKNLPTTLIGKVDYKVLEEEELSKA